MIGNNTMHPSRTYAYRRLAAAIILRAVRDVQNSNEHSSAALCWLLTSVWAAELMEFLGYDVRIIHTRVL